MTQTENSTHRYQITSSEGADLGIYEGETEADALDAMARDAGYADEAEATRVVGRPFEGTVEVVPALRCVSDRYDREGGTYDSAEDFLAMCEAAFGERPELRQLGDEWHDAEGCVLVIEQPSDGYEPAPVAPPQNEPIPHQLGVDEDGRALDTHDSADALDARGVEYESSEDGLHVDDREGGTIRYADADAEGCRADIADDASVTVRAGWYADDGGAELHFPAAEDAEDAAREYVDGGDYQDDEGTVYVEVHAYRRGTVLDVDGDEVELILDSEWHTITVEPEEPECTSGEHDWQSPHEIVGGIEENPGVQGNGGGVIIHEVCMHCGCGRTTDTWAQNPVNGAQGLTSVRYEAGKYADEIAALADVDDEDAEEEGDAATITDEQIRTLLDEAGAAGDDEQIGLCLRALGYSEGDADGHRADCLRSALSLSVETARAECAGYLAAAVTTVFELGARVCGGTGEDYDEGTVLAIDGDQVDVGWDSGVRTAQPAHLLEAL